MDRSRPRKTFSGPPWNGMNNGSSSDEMKCPNSNGVVHLWSRLETKSVDCRRTNLVRQWGESGCRENTSQKMGYSQCCIIGRCFEKRKSHPSRKILSNQYMIHSSTRPRLAQVDDEVVRQNREGTTVLVFSKVGPRIFRPQQ